MILKYLISGCPMNGVIYHLMKHVIDGYSTSL